MNLGYAGYGFEGTNPLTNLGGMQNLHYPSLAAGGGAGGLFGGVLSAAGNILASGAKTAQDLAPAAASIYSSVQAYRLKEKELDLASKLSNFTQGLAAPATQETPVVVSGGGAVPAAQTSTAGFGSMGLVLVGVLAVVILSRRK